MSTRTPMTKKRLEQYGDLLKEIVLLERQIDNTPDETYQADVVRGSYDCPPFTQHSVMISGYGDNPLLARLERRKRKLQKERLAIEDFIDDIDDSQIRMIISLKYINGLNWRQVAFSIGGKNTEKGVQKACERFLNKI